MNNHEDGAAPIYKKIGVPEFDDNPLVAHLHLPPETDRDAFKALGLRARFDPQERELPTSIRRIHVNRLRRFFIPVLPAHRQALIGITSQVFDSYLARNPMTPEGQAILHGTPSELPFRSTISLVAGHSGMGKSTLVDRILSHLGNQVYRHTKFHEQPFPETQVLYLRRNVPEHCTLRTLCSTFGDHTDQILGSRLYSGIFSKKQADRTLYLNEIKKIITNHHVGALVLDEFQNLSLMGVGAKKIISLLVNLRDELGIPIVIVGTYKALRLLEGNMSSARRLCEGGYYDLERPLSADDEQWQAFCRAAWECQWVRHPAEFSPDVAEALYDVSQGISGIMLSAFATAQLAAMESGGDETVNAKLIHKVYKERMTPLHPAIKVLQTGDPRLIDKFDDLYLNAYPSITRNEQEPQNTMPVSRSGEANGKKTSPDTLHSAPHTKNGVLHVNAGETRQKILLTEGHIEKLVTTDSMGELISILEKDE